MVVFYCTMPFVFVSCDCGLKRGMDKPARGTSSSSYNVAATLVIATIVVSTLNCRIVASPCIVLLPPYADDIFTTMITYYNTYPFVCQINLDNSSNSHFRQDYRINRIFKDHGLWLFPETMVKGMPFIPP